MNTLVPVCLSMCLHVLLVLKMAALLILNYKHWRLYAYPCVSMYCWCQKMFALLIVHFKHISLHKNIQKHYSYYRTIKIFLFVYIIKK